jgi:hypothetical protein
VVWTVMQCQVSIWAVRNDIESTNVNNIFRLAPKLLWCCFFSRWTTKYKVSDKVFVCFKYIPFIKEGGEKQVFYANWMLIYTVSRYTININVLPVRNFIVCSTWPTYNIKRLNRENDVSNFAMFIKCTCKCVHKLKKIYLFWKVIFMLIKTIY